MKPYTTLLCVILLLLFTVPSGAAFVWPVGMGLERFEARLASSTWISVDSLEAFGGEWYDNKLFFIDTENTSYIKVKILEIITLGGSNIIVKFYYNGSTMYLPFSKIKMMYEVK